MILSRNHPELKRMHKEVLLKLAEFVFQSLVILEIRSLVPVIVQEQWNLFM